MPRPMRALFALMLTACLSLSPVLADDARARLDHFFQEMTSFEAVFEQMVINERDEVLQHAQGKVYLKRPGQFRWDYQTPYNQQIVADGQYLWTYDEDLAQATVQEMGAVLGRTPIMLLSEPRALEEDFEVASEGSHQGLSWLSLTPHSGDTDFQRILIGLDERTVRMMVLYDQFGQQTRIRFEDMQLNTRIPDARFRFEPPAGVDVMRN
ncbi:outer membrane lipoprotein chaperone LolA [Ectothiorhodospira lacustris]|uniref:outer membrane lipoprotein chaperone LolA n=1 Tax=Ectothiorhodospira lacustris TaxID=2899127 RepID=UPI001EE86818|nr:outer membrane lipoprotein chaperone LolA [Ectothiorhodospira lacustris]MCG5500955.1 outer membrane lipoprotein chaperone LolA [Ectothiorhodospira lacustris]MCG5510682.1 outer membrane lipoprotein chaperone LolA [Ectothiorhodospira lacustris]MCG5522418.1 outer membrane lipoprotein chaperone LolA [Ectothiorhodospira lacustris]